MVRSCKCSCVQIIKFEDPDTSILALNLNEVKLLKDYLKDETELNSLNEIITHLNSKNVGSIMFLNEEEEYQEYFMKLHLLFSTLSKEEQAELNSRIV